MIHRDSIGSSAFIEYKDTTVNIASGPMSYTVDKAGGNFIQGPVSFSSPFTRIRFHGVFKLNPLQAFGLPSTMVTPIPTFIMSPPVAEVSSLMAISSMVLSTVA